MRRNEPIAPLLAPQPKAREQKLVRRRTGCPPPKKCACYIDILRSVILNSWYREEHAARNPRHHTPVKTEMKNSGERWDFCTNRENDVYFNFFLGGFSLPPPVRPCQAVFKRSVAFCNNKTRALLGLDMKNLLKTEPKVITIVASS